MTKDTVNIELPPYERSRDDQAWARWLARLVDTILVQPFVFIAFFAWGVAVELGRLPPESLGWFDDPLLSTTIELIFVFVVLALWEPLFLSNNATTPGKYIMGVRVVRTNGEKLSWWRALQRLLQVWIIGMGLRIPLLGFILMLIARAKLESEGVTGWAQNLDCRVEHRKRHPLIWWLVAILVIGINIAFAVFTRMSNEGF